MTPIFWRNKKETTAAASTSAHEVNALESAASEQSAQNSVQMSADDEDAGDSSDGNFTGENLNDSVVSYNADSLKVENGEVTADSSTPTLAGNTLDSGTDTALDTTAEAITPSSDSNHAPSLGTDDISAEAAPMPVVNSNQPKLSRAELVANAYDRWHGQLWAEVVKAQEAAKKARFSGQIDLTQVHPSGAARFYSHMETRLSLLVREPVRYESAKLQVLRLQEIVAHLEEKHGFAPVSLATGKVTWSALPTPKSQNLEWLDTYNLTGELRLDLTGENQAVKNTLAGNIPAAHTDSSNFKESASEMPMVVEETAPAFFRRVKVSFLAGGDAKLKLSSQVAVNPLVLKALRENGIPQDQLIQLRTLAQNPNGITEAFNYLNALGRAYLPGFSLVEQNVIGCFHTPAQILLDDLEAMAPYVQNSGILAAVAGDERRRKIASMPIPPGLCEDRSPEVERGAGDRDVAELDIVEAVASGRSLVIDAVPGTERIGTIASVAADAVASGKSMLFIPARASAGHALRKELEANGLGELVLDFSDIESVPLRIRTGLRLSKPEISVAELGKQRSDLVEAREKLELFVADLHQIDPHWGLSVHDLLEKLAALTADSDAPQTRVRLSKETLAALGGQGFQECLQLLETAHDLGLFNETEIDSPWMRSQISEVAAGEKAIARVEKLVDTILPAAISQAHRAAAETGMHVAENYAQWAEQVAVLTGIARSLDYFLPRIFEYSVSHLIAATASKAWREEHGISLKASERRACKRELEELLRPGAVPADVHAELLQVEAQREVWQRYSRDGGWPALPDGMQYIQSVCADLGDELTLLSQEVNQDDLTQLSFVQLQELLQNLQKHSAQMDILPRRNAVMQQLNQLGLQDLVADLRVRAVAAVDIAGELELAFTSSVFERLLLRSKILATLGPRDIALLLEQWRELDLAQVSSLSAPILLATISNMRETARAHRDDVLRLDSVLQQHGVAALRDMIATYSRLVQVARPIWIVPPLMVAEYIPPMPWVDLVICDTAESTSLSQVVSTLLRGRQLVVVGDVRRDAIVNAPTAIAGSEENASDKAEGLAQIESALAGFVPTLPVLALPTVRAWQDVLCVKYLSENGYEQVYQPVPETLRQRVLTLQVVDGRGVPAKQSEAVESTAAEVTAVVEQIKGHALAGETQSLAVVTVSALHARKVREELQIARKHTPALERLLDAEQDEPLVITDITQVAGLQRDHMIFSPGFGKTVHGRMNHNFGLLHEMQGFFNLIDALNVARNSISVVSSFAPTEVDADFINTPGPRLLLDLLQEAAGNPRVMGDSLSEEVSPLVADLARRIEAAGWQTAFNFGYAGSQQIPLVAGHDSIAGKWAVAVFLDDEEYVATGSLRRRDRYRKEAFERCGWQVYQTYSTSLFIDPVGQAQAIIAKLEQVADFPVGSVAADAVWVEETLDTVSTTDTQSLTAEQAEVMEETVAATLEVNAGKNLEVAALARGPRPDFVAGRELSAYTDEELDQVLAWLVSDGVARTETELVQLLHQELQIARQGVQVMAVLRNVVRRSGFART